MIKLREQLKTVRVHGQDRPDLYSPRATVSCIEVDQDKFDPRRRCHRMDAHIGVIFWSNDAEYARARDNAERQVLHIAYVEVLDALRKMRSALYARDIEASMTVIDALEEELTKP